MEQVYKKYFGLVEAPFNVTPDPSFLFLSASHREGLAQLMYGIKARRGFIVLTGEVGTGKTTLIQALLHELADDNTQTALIFNAITSPLDLLRYVCEEFNLVPPLGDLRDIHDYGTLLNDFLLEKYRQGKNVALIIDEAQNLSPEVLESIRVLSNFETTKDKLLQILLVGQPEFAERLNSPRLRQLKQRITLRHHLLPLTIEESRQYIATRLGHAGGNPEIFPPKTVEVLHRYCGGIPRLINVVCDNAMISAYALGKRLIEPALIHEVAEDLCLSPKGLRSNAEQGENLPRVELRAPIRMEVVKPNVAAATKAVRIGTNQPSSDRFENLPADFLLSVREALIDAMGPMGAVVLAEQVKALGGSMERFSREKLWPLVDLVGREIFDDFLRERFRLGVSERLAQLDKKKKGVP